eukprot:4154170-Prymnesium_polylepis.1
MKARVARRAGDDGCCSLRDHGPLRARQAGTMLVAALVTAATASPVNTTSHARQLLDGCGIVKSTQHPTFAGLVRGYKYTVEEDSGCTYEGAQCTTDSLDPICGSSAKHCAEKECASGPNGELEVRFNSRSYVLTEYNGRCEGSRLGDSYTCVDYRKGAMFLPGKTLSMTLDLSGAGCGCNAAVYLVAMPQNLNPTRCHDYYCDANSVCGVACAEIDLVEANKVAFVSTVHVADDKDGENFGLGHYVIPTEKRWVSGKSCSYGPSTECTINTNQPFRASFTFATGGSFEYTAQLEQEGRLARLASPVRYVGKPSNGRIGSADDANRLLASHLAGGMTLVVSYWAGATKDKMAWLDQPCTQNEKM